MQYLTIFLLTLLNPLNAFIIQRTPSLLKVQNIKSLVKALKFQNKLTILRSSTLPNEDFDEVEDDVEEQIDEADGVFQTESGDEGDYDPDQIDNEIEEKSPKIGLKRRRALLSKSFLPNRKKLSWEERFEDNPLKADSPTVNYEKPVDVFSKCYVAIAKIESNDMLLNRGEAWVHHMQWVRRTVLIDGLIEKMLKEPTFDSNNEKEFKYKDLFQKLEVPALKVETAFTVLSEDRLRPKSQMLIIKANQSSEILDYLKKEPLLINNGISPWEVYELDIQKQRGTFAISGDLHSPYVFLSYNDHKNPKKGGKSKTEIKQINEKIENSIQYHIDCSTADEKDPNLKFNGMNRVALYGVLKEISGENEDLNEEEEENRLVLGNLILFNGKSNNDSFNYLKGDSSVLAENDKISSKVFDNTIMAPLNEQDVSGMNHFMARSFGELEEIDQLHYMDPEDLLEMDLKESLTDSAANDAHILENKRVLSMLQDNNLSFRYNRLTIQSAFNSTGRVKPAYNPELGFVYGSNQSPVRAAMKSLLSESSDSLTAEETVDQWNRRMSRFQKVRLENALADAGFKSQTAQGKALSSKSGGKTKKKTDLDELLEEDDELVIEGEDFDIE